MPRKPRLPSESGIYHVMVRGNEQKEIFRDEEDKSVLISILDKKKANLPITFFAVCLMSNHFHLLGKFDPLSDLSTYMNKVSTSYASYYNKRFNRVGHVFQGRYKSEAIQNDQHFLACVRYIHHNPVKAGMVKKPEEYSWSSYADYISSSGMFKGFVDQQNVLSYFAKQRKTAVKAFQQFSGMSDQDVFIDCDETGSMKNKSILTISQANQLIHDYLNQMEIGITDLCRFEHIKKRNYLIQQLKKKTNFSIRQIAELLNINKNSVINAL